MCSSERAMSSGPSPARSRKCCGVTSCARRISRRVECAGFAHELGKLRDVFVGKSNVFRTVAGKVEKMLRRDVLRKADLAESRVRRFRSRAWKTARCVRRKEQCLQDRRRQGRENAAA